MPDHVCFSVRDTSTLEDIQRHEIALAYKERVKTRADYHRAREACTWVTTDSERPKPRSGAHRFVAQTNAPAHRQDSFFTLPFITRKGQAPEDVLNKGAEWVRVARDIMGPSPRLVSNRPFAHAVAAAVASAEVLCLMGAWAGYGFGVRLDIASTLVAAAACLIACEIPAYRCMAKPKPALPSLLSWAMLLERGLTDERVHAMEGAQAQRERQFEALLHARAAKREAKQRLRALVGPPPQVLVAQATPERAVRLRDLLTPCARVPTPNVAPPTQRPWRRMRAETRSVDAGY